MKRIIIAVMTVVAVVTGFGLSAQAGKLSTKYSYYTVSGTSARALHNAIIVPTGLFSSRREYANITFKPNVTGRLKPGKVCRVTGFAINASYTIRLPRLRKGLRLPSKLTGQYRQFASFLKRHELTHRRIWNGCISRIERRIRSLRIKSCSVLDKKAGAIITKEWNACKSKQARFDKSERPRVRRQALVVAATRGTRGKSTKIASSKKRKQTRSSALRRRTKTNFNN